jgi:glycine betaine/proline transport system substrate-binding protein
MKKMILIFILSIVLFLTSCEQIENLFRAQENILRIGHSNVAFDQAIAFVIKGILDQQPNLRVELFTAPDSLLFRFLATDELDVVVSGWLPHTHRRYIDRYSHRITRHSLLNDSLGVFLAVPWYVEIDYIYELPNIAHDLQNTILIPESRNAVFELSENILNDYNLRGFDLIEMPWDNIIDIVSDHISEEWPIAFIGVRPHYSFYRYGLKTLRCTQGTFSDFERAYIFINNDLPERLPLITNFLGRVSFTLTDIEYIMTLNQVFFSDPNENANRWINENTFRVNRWLVGR